MKALLIGLCLLPLAACTEANQALFYDSYGSSQHFVIKGRLIEAETLSKSNEHDSKLRNLWRSFRTFKNEEQDGVTLTIKAGTFQTTATTDDEGYFHVEASPEQALDHGWQRITVRGGDAQGTGHLLIVPRANTLGVISDIDDTVLMSDVLNKKNLLRNTFLKNIQQRQGFPGTAAFYASLLSLNADPWAAPMFYLSASPRQLAGNIEAFLIQHHFPRGVLVTKQISGQGHDPWLDQQRYKTAQIETIFSALPWVKFTLVGDDGERDPEIYQAIQQAHPQQVHAIYIRNVNPDPNRPSYPGQLKLDDAVIAPSAHSIQEESTAAGALSP
ncbi:MAG TPA: phosphatase domain-containing protein [Thiobacillus sp.]